MNETTIKCKFCLFDMVLFYTCTGHSGLYQNDDIYRCPNCGAMLIKEKQGYEDDYWEEPIEKNKENEMSGNKEVATVDSAMVNTNTGEISQTREAVTALQEIQGAMIMARRFPRNEMAAFQKMDSICKRASLARVAQYSYPRGSKQIKGPSVYIARELARCWSNVRYGIQIVSDNEEQMTIRGWAWDVEANNKVEIEDTFKKLVQRKKDGVTKWVVPDERDLRELIMKRGAIATRGAIFGILPRDYVEDALLVCAKTLATGITDPDGEIKNILVNFNKLRVTVEQLNFYVGTESWTADEIVELNNVYNAIKDGVSTVKSYFGKSDKDKKKPIKGELSEADMSAGKKEDHQDIRQGEKDKLEPETKAEPPKEETKEEKESPPEPATDESIKKIKFLLDTKSFSSAKLASMASKVQTWLASEGQTEEDALFHIGQIESLKDLT